MLVARSNLHADRTGTCNYGSQNHDPMQSPTSPRMSALDLAIISPLPKTVERSRGHSLNAFAICEGLLTNLVSVRAFPGEHLLFPVLQTLQARLPLLLKGYEVILESAMGCNVRDFSSLVIDQTNRG